MCKPEGLSFFDSCMQFIGHPVSKNSTCEPPVFSSWAWRLCFVAEVINGSIETTHLGTGFQKNARHWEHLVIDSHLTVELDTTDCSLDNLPPASGSFIKHSTGRAMRCPSCNLLSPSYHDPGRDSYAAKHWDGLDPGLHRNHK